MSTTLDGISTWPARTNAKLDEIVQRRSDLRAIALMRMLFGAIVIRHLWPDLRAPVVPVERFHVPWWSWLPVPSPSAYRFLLWLGVAAGVAMILGLAARLATVTAFATVSYLVFVDMTGFSHNRGFLMWMLFGLSLLPTGGAFTVVNLFRRRLRRQGSQTSRGGTALTKPSAPDVVGPVWPVLMLQVVVSSVYLTSGLTKLANPDWRSGLVLWDRIHRYEHFIPFDGWIYDVLLSRAFHHVLSPAAIATEIFLGVGLWFRRTRWVAAGMAILFHLSIELTASVQTFSYSAIAALLIWTVPTLEPHET